MRVRIKSAATTAKLSARRAGRNCTFAIHPSHAWIVPVKSRNRSVTPMKKTDARMILIFLSIVSLFSTYECKYKQKEPFIRKAPLQIISVLIHQLRITQSKYSLNRFTALSSCCGVLDGVPSSLYSHPRDSYLCFPRVWYGRISTLCIIL